MKNHIAITLTLAAMLLIIQCLTGSCTATANSTEPKVFFDKPAYYPPASAFWNQEASLVQIRITVINKYIASRQISIKILSSIDSKKITLQKIAPGRYQGNIVANCLTLGRTPPLDSTNLNVRYGDTITARYTNQIKTTAFVIFPRYVLENFANSIYGWQLFDPEGTPLVDYGSPIGTQYNPVETCHYALANYHAYMMTGNSSFREKFLIQANWLIRNAKQRGKFAIWEYDFDWPAYNCTRPWVSAMAQGEGLSVLTRAYILTGNSTYLQFAQAATRSFECEMTEGGVRHTDTDGIWYEEYADTEAPSSKVLNGLIFSLFGLFEYSFGTNNSEANQLFWDVTRSLSSNLYQYDTGSWSYYDLLHDAPASLAYHLLHVNQLGTMYRLTGCQVFQEYSARFLSYIH